MLMIMREYFSEWCSLLDTIPFVTISGIAHRMYQGCSVGDRHRTVIKARVAPMSGSRLWGVNAR